MTAREIIVACFSDLNINDPGEAIEPADAQTALRLLNNLCSSWRTQSLITIAIVRQIFNLVAGQQVYSIGLGGDFNVSRPTAIPAAGLLLSGLSATTSISITRVLTVGTVTWTAHGLSVGDQVVISGCTDPLYNGVQTVATAPTANTFTYAVFGAPITPAAGTPLGQTFEENAVEIPRPVTTDQNWWSVQLKTMPSGLFTGVYYNPTQPFGQITLWPVPDSTDNQLVLYLQQQFEGFDDFDTDYTFPDLPGMSEALQYNLDIRLAIPFASAAEMTPDIKELARTSLGLVKRQNYRLRDLANETAAAIGRDNRGGYNINTGQGG
jgi:hypothetical protein